MVWLNHPWGLIPPNYRVPSGQIRPIAGFDNNPLPYVFQPRERTERRRTPEMLAKNPPSVDVAKVEFDDVSTSELSQNAINGLARKFA